MNLERECSLTVKEKAQCEWRTEFKKWDKEWSSHGVYYIWYLIHIYQDEQWTYDKRPWVSLGLLIF